MTCNGIDSLIDVQMSGAARAAPKGARMAGKGATPAAGRAPDPEVVATAKWRRFAVSEKRRVPAEACECKRPGEQEVIKAFRALPSGLAVTMVSQALGASRTSVYRGRQCRRGIIVRAGVPRPRPPLSLSDTERETLPADLDSKRFADLAPRAIYAPLLDDGRYLASACTAYRVLAAAGQTLERHSQRVQPQCHEPELLTTGPRKILSCNRTEPKAPVRWNVSHLCVILDIFTCPVISINRVSQSDQYVPTID